MITSLIVYRDALEEGYCAVSVDGVVGGVVDEISFNCDIVCADSSDAASAEVVDVKVLDGDMVATLVDAHSIASTVRWADCSSVYQVVELPQRLEMVISFVIVNVPGRTIIVSPGTDLFTPVWMTEGEVLLDGRLSDCWGESLNICKGVAGVGTAIVVVARGANVEGCGTAG